MRASNVLLSLALSFVAVSAAPVEKRQDLPLEQVYLATCTANLPNNPVQHEIAYYRNTNDSQDGEHPLFIGQVLNLPATNPWEGLRVATLDDKTQFISYQEAGSSALTPNSQSGVGYRAAAITIDFRCFRDTGRTLYSDAIGSITRTCTAEFYCLRRALFP